MKESNNKTWIIVCIILGVAMIGVYLFGRYNGIKTEQNNNIDKEIKPLVIKEKITQKQIDSIYSIVNKDQNVKNDFKDKEIEIIKQIEYITLTKPKDTACNQLYDDATKKISLLNNRIDIKDSIENISNLIIDNQYSIISRKDSLISYKDKQIQLIKNKKPIPKKIGIGLHVGYGMSVTESRVELRPYVGIGVSYNVFTF